MSEQTLHDVITDLAKVIELEQKAHMKAIEMIEQAVIAERESCAKMIESFVEDYDREYRELGFELAERIRLKKQAQPKAQLKVRKEEIKKKPPLEKTKASQLSALQVAMLKQIATTGLLPLIDRKKGEQLTRWSLLRNDWVTVDPNYTFPRRGGMPYVLTEKGKVLFADVVKNGL